MTQLSLGCGSFAPLLWVVGVVLFMPLAALTTAVVVIVRACTNRRPAVPPANLCRQCGYDVRATPDAAGPVLAACPECGRSTAGGTGHQPDGRAIRPAYRCPG